MNKVGLIGFGFIGKAFAHGFHLHADIKVYDKYDNQYDSLEDTVNQSSMLFINVPTPMHEDGTQDLSNVDDAIYNIDRVSDRAKIIVIRTTVVPGTTRNYSDKYRNHHFVFNPEFLTQRSYKLDFINPSRIILGGIWYPLKAYNAIGYVRELYRSRFPHTPIYVTTWEGAELVKYMNNTFFAVKLAFLNEMYDIAEMYGLKYNDLKDMWLSDGRIGNSHADIPGHDGQRGYGGKCIPKDIRALIKWAENCGLYLDMCKAAEKVNERVRKEKDWEKIKGATSKNNYGEKNEEIN